MPKPIPAPTARQDIQIGDRLMVQCEDGLFYKSVVIGLSEKSITILFDSGAEQAEISHQAPTDPIRGICAIDKRDRLDTGISGEEADMLLQTELPIGEATQGRQRRPRRTRKEMEAAGASRASVEHFRPSGITRDMSPREKGYRNKLAALPTLTHDALMGVFGKANLADLPQTANRLYDEFHEIRLLEEAFPDTLPSLDPAHYEISQQVVKDAESKEVETA